ncbi:ribosome biogenesis protein ytm1 [Neurospora sp. IMI 360204]|nr:ribosome biogenesis protein ytm1 [Neurospora sp. IMI 360204]
MAIATQDSPAGQIAQALVDFSVEGAFPEESVSSLTVDSHALPAAIEALASAKAKLQAEIHTINEETADDVRTWKTNAQSVQDDIIRSKALANDIMKQSEAPQASGKAIEEAEARAVFLARELDYNTQLRSALKGIKAVNQILDQVEQARDERRILDALHLLERSWKELDAVPVNKSCRAIKLLDIRAFELKSDVHQVFDHVWNTLIHVDIEGHKVSISDTKQDEAMSLSDAVIGLKAYKEVDQRAAQLWHDIDKAILAPRLDINQERLPTIRINENTLEIGGTSDQSIEAVFRDLEQIFAFLVEKLPPDLVETISTVLLPGLIPTITKTWLDLAVPSSLEEMDRFQATISTTKGFCTTLKALGLSHLNELQEWTESAPRVWLSKRREAALDQMRTQLSQGLGAPKQVERVEKQVVSKSEGQQLAANGAMVTEDDGGWDAWGSDGEQETGGQQSSKPAATTSATEPSTDAIDDAADAWGWGEEDPEPEKSEEPQQKKQKQEEDDDPTEAWGWGDDAQNDDTAPEPAPTAPSASSKPQTRELTFKETYSISSLPQPVLDLISSLVEDGAALTQGTYANSPVAAAAAGLFGLPTLALAMFRAVAPHYYAPDLGGNMFLYNDATYLSERLAEFAEEWVKRDNISTRAQTMLRLDNDIKSMQSFANRAYSNEMSIQKTVLRDLLGGEQNLIQQDDTESCVSAAVARVRSLAIAWESILSRSAWQQAVGSLVDAVANKIIGDVMDLPGIGQDEAYNIANHIASVTALDDLFLPSRFATESGNAGETNEIPTTAQYAGSWLRLKYLSEVLQSNLKDVRYLWLESELSLYFSADEVVDLVNLSFEDNPRTREVIREIRARPNPLG